MHSAETIQESFKIIADHMELISTGVSAYLLEEDECYVLCYEVRKMDGKADNPSGILIHHDHDPVCLQENGLTAEQVNTPQAVLGMTQCC